jgi:hypothetical protein
MAKLSASRRKKLPDSAFAYPSKRKYPLDTVKRARNALAQAKKSNTFGSYSTVARKVRAKWGDKVKSVGKSQGTVSAPGYRKRK